MTRTFLFGGVWILLTCSLAPGLPAAEISELIELVQGVGPKGDGHPRAVKAARQLAEAPPSEALTILAAMDQANPLAANWLSGTFQAVADKALKSGQLDSASLEAFVKKTSHSPEARTLAFQYLSKLDAEAERRLVPGMLNDPAPALRRKAVQHRIDLAKAAGDPGQGAAIWKQALDGAVDEDQVNEIAAALKKQGEEIDIREHFGLIRQWYVIGPFDNRDQKGFPIAYPPETGVNLGGEYEGMNGPVKWIPLASDEADGAFDLAKLTEPHKGAVDYAYTEFHAAAEQPVQFRLATPNAWKLWVNGELVFAREEYHRGMRFDQYIVPGRLRQGTNTILLKICQNEQDQDWAQRWAFQFRIVDLAGRALHQAGN